MTPHFSPTMLIHTETPELSQHLTTLIHGEFEAAWEVTTHLLTWQKKASESELNELVQTLKSLVLNKQIDLEKRWLGAKILGETPHPEALAGMLTLLEVSDSEDLSTLASQSLANLGQPAIAVLKDLLTDPKTRFFAVTTLTYIRNPQVVDPLLQVIDDDNPQIRQMAIATLSSFHDRQLPPHFLRGLEDPAAIVRKESLSALGWWIKELQDQGLVAKIAPLLQDLNLSVCQQAAITLSKIRTEEAAIALTDILKKPTTPPPLQSDLVKALVWQETPFSFHCLRVQLPQLEPEVLEAAFLTLGRIEREPVKALGSEILVDFFQHHRDDLTQEDLLLTLAQTLGKLRQPAAETILEELMHHQSDRIRLQAEASLRTFRKQAKRLYEIGENPL